jgi:hypothetical protein
LGHFISNGNAFEVARRFRKQGACEKEYAEEQGSNEFHKSDPAAIFGQSHRPPIPFARIFSRQDLQGQGEPFYALAKAFPCPNPLKIQPE